MAYDEVQGLSLPEISDHANQPSGYNFPKRSVGKTKVVHCAFQQSWFGKKVAGMFMWLQLSIVIVHM